LSCDRDGSDDHQSSSSSAEAAAEAEAAEAAEEEERQQTFIFDPEKEPNAAQSYQQACILEECSCAWHLPPHPVGIHPASSDADGLRQVREEGDLG
jgi:hypothetical protein